MNLFTKLVGWLRRPYDPEAEAEEQRMRAERDAQRALMGPRGIPVSNLPSKRDTDSRR